MTIRRSTRPVAASRIATEIRSLLGASTLCAIATVAAGGAAHINTAYFAWTDAFDLVWLSHPGAAHSRNVRSRRSAAVSVYDSGQVWGRADRGIQLFGSATEASGAAAEQAANAYETRFARYRGDRFDQYRFYRFRPSRAKLFDERSLGEGVFVVARVRHGAVEWMRTEVYRSSASG